MASDCQVFTIFAFATAGGYSGSTHFTVKCPGTAMEVQPKFWYPFRLADSSYSMPTCNGTEVEATYLQGDFRSSAEFFVSVGVFAFLYCTVTLVLYLGYQHVYRQTSRGPLADLVVTGVFAFLWLVSSSAWGKGLTDIKFATNPDHLMGSLKAEHTVEAYASMGRLNASVIFGFLNLILWAGNCWFIYKETHFHKDPNAPAPMQEGDLPGP
ncbi:unnamed protein product [Arctogadus glacialis]